MRIPILLLMTCLLSAADASWAQVQTVLSARCIECHGEKKQKGDLRLDTPEWLEKGSKEGAVVVAGKPELSKLYTMTALPDGHDDRMPPRGARLTDEQLEQLKSWIAAGAKTAVLEPAKQPPLKSKALAATDSQTTEKAADPKVADGKVAADKAADNMMDPMAASMASTDTLPKPDAKLPTTKITKPLDKPAPEAPLIPAPFAPEFAITALTSQQFVITTLPGGWLDVNAAHTKNGLTDAHLPLLQKIAPAVAFLDLANSGITDRQLQVITACTNLLRLHLEHTPISDAGLSALSACQHLTYLNLFGTSIGDGGLAALRSLTQLDELYVWQSKVTPAGIAALKKALPELDIINGPDDLPTAKLEKKKKKK